MPDNNHDDVNILVEFVEPKSQPKRQTGFEDVNRSSDKDGQPDEEKSREAVKQAIKTIEWVADEAKTLISKGTDRPDTVELEFGISLTTKGSMLVVQTKADFHIKAKISWQKNDKDN